MLTRSPRSLLSLAAVGAQVAAAAYLLGEGMAANAPTEAAWRAWDRDLQWGATLAPALWFWVTLLLLREQEYAGLRAYLRWLGYPIGVLIAAAGIFLTASIYVDDWLFRWSAPVPVAPDTVIYSHFHLTEGPVYPIFVALLLAATLGAAVNVAMGWWHERDSARRRRFAWLFLSALLFLLSANALGIASSSSVELLGDTAIGPSHLLLGAAMLAMAWNVAAYSVLVKGQVIRTDVFYFLTSLAVICIIYAGAFVALSGPNYSFAELRLLMVVLILAILTHALVDVGRRALDPLFFGGDVQRLRSNLSAAVQDAALTQDLGLVLDQAQKEIDEVSVEHLTRLTEDALRRLNNPAALAQCELVSRLPRTLTGNAHGTSAGAAGRTPLEQARVLREALTAAIERLKPADGDAGALTPGALQYSILREEYLQGMPNKQIMTRHSISESTFHRNRREAIGILAREFSRQEDLLSHAEVDSSSGVT